MIAGKAAAGNGTNHIGRGMAVRLRRLDKQCDAPGIAQFKPAKFIDQRVGFFAIDRG
jgi:hypothetical protein